MLIKTHETILAERLAEIPRMKPSVDKGANSSAHTDFMNECVPMLMSYGKNQFVAVAACLNMWRDAWEEAHPEGAVDPGPPRPEKSWDESQHPRDPAGTSTGGRFASGGDGGKLSSDETAFVQEWAEGGNWSDYQHAARAVIAGVEPKDYVCYDCSGDDATRYAKAEAMLDAINNSPTVKTPLYRGLVNEPWAKDGYKVGDRFSESLTSWTSKPELARDFSEGKFSGGGETGQVLTLDVAKSVNSKGLNVSDNLASSSSEILRNAGEYLTSGEYEVTAVNGNEVTVRRVGPAAADNIAKSWDEDKHPRDPKGTATGGQFTSAEGGGGGNGIDGLPSNIVVKDRLLNTAIARGAFTHVAKEIPTKDGAQRYEVTTTAKIPEGIEKFVARERKNQVGYYNPKLADLVTVDADEPLITYTYAKAKEGLAQDIEPLPGKDVIYRGMTAEEYENIQKTGKVASLGEYNIGEDQKGLTYWGSDPQIAQSYANGFAPWPLKATFEKPAYVVAARRPDEKDIRHVAGTGENEVGVARPITKDEIIAVWRGDVYAHDPARQDLVPMGYGLDETEYKVGMSSGARSDVVWKKISGDETKAWDEGKHPRGETSPGTNPGSFAPAGGGEVAPKEKKKVKPEDFAKADISIGGSEADRAAFAEEWDKHLGDITPEEFKQRFLGGVDGSMAITQADRNTWNVSGNLKDKDEQLGPYQRTIDWRANKAKSNYFKIKRDKTGGDYGKFLLAGNVDMYRTLGLDKVEVLANIDVGGYAWAKYGYVPTQQAWNELRSGLLARVEGRRPAEEGEDVVQSWDEISESEQERIEQEWKAATRDEFIESEVSNWRDSGEAQEDARYNIASEFNADSHIEWATDALKEWRDDYETEAKESGDLPPIHFTNEQILDAMSVDFEHGQRKPKFEFDDSKLQQPSSAPPPEQLTLPGIEKPDFSKLLTDSQRRLISAALRGTFERQAEREADEIEPPEHLAENVDEYQSEYWGSMRDSDRYENARRHNLLPARAPEGDVQEPLPLVETPLTQILHSANPKAMWALADSADGKRLLLGTSWQGVLNLKDEQSMKRFDAYVSRRKHAA